MGIVVAGILGCEGKGGHGVCMGRRGGLVEDRVVHPSTIEDHLLHSQEGEHEAPGLLPRGSVAQLEEL